MSIIKKFNLYEFTLWGQDLVFIVRIRESPYYRGFFYRKYMSFVGPLETVRNKQVSVPRGSTVSPKSVDLRAVAALKSRTWHPKEFHCYSQEKEKKLESSDLSFISK